MIDNLLLFTIGGLLAAVYFLAPVLFRSQVRAQQLLWIALLYLVACVAAFFFTDGRSAFVVVELGLAFTVISKLLAINFEMVRHPNDPKHHRCY